jgi:hypothetical protein
MESEFLRKIRQIRAYTDYVENHYNNVQKAWHLLNEKCAGKFPFIDNDYLHSMISANVKNHDLSKLSMNEFLQYQVKFFPTHMESFQNDFNDENFNKAWENHLKENPHHWQNWTQNEFDFPFAKEIYFIENIIDWIAMGFQFGDTAKIYYEKNKHKIALPDWAIKQMYEIFECIYEVQSESAD